MSIDPVKVPHRTRAGSFSSFQKRYDPKVNEDGSFLFEYNEVKGLDERYVWTVLEAEGKLYLSPGFRIVNRIAYVIGQKPWGSIETFCPGYLYA